MLDTSARAYPITVLSDAVSPQRRGSRTTGAHPQPRALLSPLWSPTEAFLSHREAKFFHNLLVAESAENPVSSQNTNSLYILARFHVDLVFHAKICLPFFTTLNFPTLF